MLGSAKMCMTVQCKVAHGKAWRYCVAGRDIRDHSWIERRPCGLEKRPPRGAASVGTEAQEPRREPGRNPECWRRRKPAPTQKSKSGERPGMAWATPLATVAWPGIQPVERRGADMAAWGPHGPAWRAVVVQPAGGRGGRERKRRILKEELLGRALSSAMLVRRLRRSGSRRRSSAFTLPTVGSSGSIVTLPTVGLGGP